MWCVQKIYNSSLPLACTIRQHVTATSVSVCVFTCQGLDERVTDITYDVLSFFQRQHIVNGVLAQWRSDLSTRLLQLRWASTGGQRADERGHHPGNVRYDELPMYPCNFFIQGKSIWPWSTRLSRLRNLQSHHYYTSAQKLLRVEKSDKPDFITIPMYCKILSNPILEEACVADTGDDRFAKSCRYQSDW